MKLERIPEPIFITGATGFVGSHLSKRLYENGYRIRVLVRSGKALPDYFSDKKVEVIKGDLDTIAQDKNILNDIKTIFHNAAIVGDWGPRKLYQKINIEGLEDILQQASKNNTHVIHLSSVAVYGNNIKTKTCTEGTDFGKQVGNYSWSKQLQEIMINKYIKEKNVKATMIRASQLYGPGCKPWVNEVSRLMLKGMPVLIGNGEKNSGLCWIDNLINFLILCALNTDSIGRTFNMYDEDKISWKTYFSDLAKIIGAKEPKKVPYNIALVMATAGEFLYKLFQVKTRPPITHEALNLVGSDNVYPIEKAKNELGYKAKVSYKEAMEILKNYLTA